MPIFLFVPRSQEMRALASAINMRWRWILNPASAAHWRFPANYRMNWRIRFPLIKVAVVRAGTFGLGKVEDGILMGWALSDQAGSTATSAHPSQPARKDDSGALSESRSARSGGSGKTAHADAGRMARQSPNPRRNPSELKRRILTSCPPKFSIFSPTIPIKRCAAPSRRIRASTRKWRSGLQRPMIPPAAKSLQKTRRSPQVSYRNSVTTKRNPCDFAWPTATI